MSDVILSTEGLGKSFGGLAAVKEVSLEFVERQVHAIIGPNGAGQTTLINLLSGAQGFAPGYRAQLSKNQHLCGIHLFPERLAGEPVTPPFNALFPTGPQR